MINQSKEFVEQRYSTLNGYDANSTVIYGDTDSVMVDFGVDNLRRVMELGREAAAFISEKFPRPIQLEFEKVYYPYLLINKKRYAGLFWTKPDNFDKLDTKGIETVRRDNCPLVKNVVDTCLRKILIDRDVNGAIEYTKGMISDLLCNNLDLSLLVISKQITKSSDAYDAKQPHVVLAERMRQREPGSAPQIGDRVYYVIVQGAKGSKIYERAEDPNFVLENGLPIDAQYYLEQQLTKPLTRIFKPLLPNVHVLFSGEHTRRIARPSARSGVLMRFATRVLNCLMCKTPLGPDSKTLCQYCREQGKEGEIYQEAVYRLRRCEENFSQVWTECQRCSQSLHQEVLCSSRDCPLFYLRRKVQKDLEDAEDIVSRFSLEW